MNTLIIARRELTEHRLAWAAAVIAGLTGAAAPRLLTLLGQPSGDGTVFVALFSLNFGFTFALALVLGATMFPNDLGNRRLGFYLARPVSLGAILGGRFLGAWILAAGGGLLAGLLPVLPHPETAHWVLWLELGAFNALVAIPCLLLAHVGGTLARSRSRWILLDLCTFGGYFASVPHLLERAFQRGGNPGTAWAMAIGTVLLVAVLTTGIWRQLALGGTDLHRGHRALSLTCAAGLAATLLLGALLTRS